MVKTENKFSLELLNSLLTIIDGINMTNDFSKIVYFIENNTLEFVFLVEYNDDDEEFIEIEKKLIECGKCLENNYDDIINIEIVVCTPLDWGYGNDEGRNWKLLDNSQIRKITREIKLDKIL